jgi:hypothetical protein
MPVESMSELDHIFIPIKTQDAHFVLGFFDLEHEATYVVLSYSIALVATNQRLHTSSAV